jgi:hypothetical protein
MRRTGVDPTPRYLRVLAAVVLLALIGGWVVLLGYPSRTGELFVWPIKPRLSAFMLGSAYAAGTYYWLRVLLGAAWHAIVAGLLPVALFATTLGLATALHWDRFHHHGVLICVWVGLYVSVPLALPVIWLAGRGRKSPPAQSGEAMVPLRLRGALAATGSLQVLIGLALFAFPGSVARYWPWPLTDLTARTTAAWFAWGLVWIMLLPDSRWSSARIAVEATLVGVLVALSGALRAWPELDSHRVSTWIFVASLAVALVTLSTAYVALNHRRTAHVDAGAMRKP